MGCSHVLVRPLLALQLLLATATLACAAGGEDLVDTTRWAEELHLQDGIFDVEGTSEAGLWLASRGLYHRVGETWERVEGTDARVLRAISITEGAENPEIWAVGTGGLALRGDGRRFEELRVAEPTQALHHVQALPGQVTVSAADASYWRSDGQTWREVRPPELAGRFIGGIYAASQGLLFLHTPAASTGKPLTLSRTDGATTTVDTLGRGWRYAASIDGSGPADVWAVGTRGKLIGKGGFAVHFDGKSWSDVSIPVDVPLTDISVRSAEEAWACGWKGTLLRWDGHVWSRLETGIDKPLTRIFVDPQGVVRVVLADTRLLRWTGGTP